MAAAGPWDTSSYGSGGGAASPQGFGAGPGPWGLPARSGDPAKAACVVAAVFFGLGAAFNLLGFFSPGGAWKNPVNDAAIVLLAAGCVLAAALLVPQRLRGLGAGLGIAQGLTESARYVYSVDFGQFHYLSTIDKITNVGSYISVALGGIVAAIAVLRERRLVTRGPRQVVPPLVLGVPGTLLVLGSLLGARYDWSYGDGFSYQCCGWSTGDGFNKASAVLTALALAACVLLATLVTRDGFARGILAGTVVFLVTECAIALIDTLAPMQAAYNFGGHGESITAHPKTGLWLVLAGTVLFAIALFLRGGNGGVALNAAALPGTVPGYPQQPPYPQPGYAQPGYGQPGYPQPGYPQSAFGQPAYGQPAWQQPTMPQQQSQPPQQGRPWPQQPGWPQQQPAQQPPSQQPPQQQSPQQGWPAPPPDAP